MDENKDKHEIEASPSAAPVDCRTSTPWRAWAVVAAQLCAYFGLLAGLWVAGHVVHLAGRGPVALLAYWAAAMAALLIVTEPPPPVQRRVDAAWDAVWGVAGRALSKSYAWGAWARRWGRLWGIAVLCMVVGIAASSTLSALTHGGNQALPDHGQGAPWGWGCAPPPVRP